MSITYRGFVWEYRTAPCEDDKGTSTLEVCHPASGRWEFADYVLTEATGQELEAAVREFADNQLD